MISVEKLIGLTHSYNPRSDEKLIRHAFDYAKKMHKGQLRRSGEPYFMHPYAVAMQLAEQHMDDATVEDFIIGGGGTEGIQGQLLRLGSGRDYAGKIEMMKNLTSADHIFGPNQSSVCLSE